MDMESRSYIGQLAKLVRDGKVSMTLIDDAVRRILTKKFEMGLFDDPYRFCNDQRAARQWDNPGNLRIEQEMAEKSIVLLKNDGQLLPLSGNLKTIALIGPLVKAVRENLGFWSYEWNDDTSRIVTLWDGIKKKVGNGVTMQVAITWAGSTLDLYLNGTLVKSTRYTPPTPNWTNASVFDLGAYEYQAFGGYDSCDDIIGEFTVGPVTQN